MKRQVRCECGYRAVGETDGDVIAQIRQHLAADHPELAASETVDDIRSWIELLPD